MLSLEGSSMTIKYEATTVWPSQTILLNLVNTVKGNSMARCEICNKAGQSGNNVSHSKRHTRTRWFANVQKTTIYTDGVPRKLNICTRCLRTQYKATTKS